MLAEALKRFMRCDPTRSLAGSPALDDDKGVSVPRRVLPRPSQALRVLGAATTAAALVVVGSGTPSTAASSAGQDYLFDFQCAGNPTADGYTAVLPTTAWSAGGFGFEAPLPTICR